MTAEYRSVQTRMWREDDWFQNQPTDARLLFIYLFTNPSASVSGIYRLPLRTIVFESGLSAERVNELLTQFSRENKAHVENGVVWVVKMRDNQLPGRTLSDKIVKHLEGEIAKIPPCRLKNMYLQAYGYPIDTLCIPMCTDTITDTIPVTDTDTVSAPIGALTPKPPKTPKPPASAQADMFGAICETCELDPKLKREMVAKTAQSLLAAGYTPEQVREFKPWWLADQWRAEHTPVPTIAKLTTFLQQFRNDQTKPRVIPTNGYANGNGHAAGTSKVDKTLANAAALREMLERGGTL